MICQWLGSGHKEALGCDSNKNVTDYERNLLYHIFSCNYNNNRLFNRAT